MSDCRKGADPFIEQWFHDCVYNARDHVGFALGLFSIVCWLFAQLPQYIRNFKNKSAEALSPWFLAEWLLGDTCNLLGALLQGQQLPTTLYTAMYFVMADVFMMMQYIYYGALQRRREKLLQLQARRRRHDRRHELHHQQQQQQQQSFGDDGGGSAGRALGRDADPSSNPSSHANMPGLAGYLPLGDADGSGGRGTQPQLQERRRQQQQQQQGSDMHAYGGSKQHLLQQQQQQRLWALQDQQQALLTQGPEVLIQQQQQQQQQQQHYSSSSNSSKSTPYSSPRHADAVSAAPVLGSSAPPPAVPAAAAAARRQHRATRLPVFMGSCSSSCGVGSRSLLAVAVLLSLAAVSLLVPASFVPSFFPPGLLSRSSGGGIGISGASPVLLATPTSLQAAQQSSAGPLDISSSSSSTGSGSSEAVLLLQQQQQLAGIGQHGTAAAPDGGSSSSISGSRGNGAGAAGAAGAAGVEGAGAGTGNGAAAAAGGDGGNPGDISPERDWGYVVGTGIGYVSSCLYLMSRVSQIHKNYSRKSSEGLAIAMFMMAMCANLCTGSSILLRTYSVQQLLEQLPWLIGTLGTISLDCIILSQFVKYSGKAAGVAEDNAPLLPGAGGSSPDGDGRRLAHHHQQHHHHRHHHHHQQLLLHSSEVEVLLPTATSPQHS